MPYIYGQVSLLSLNTGTTDKETRKKNIWNDQLSLKVDDKSYEQA